MHLEKGAHKYGPTITSRKKRTQITWVRSAFTASCLLPVSNESHFHCTSKLLSPSMWTFSNHSLSTPISQNKLHLQWPLNLLMLSQNRHAISSRKLHSQDRALTASHRTSGSSMRFLSFWCDIQDKTDVPRFTSKKPHLQKSHTNRVVTSHSRKTAR